VVTATCRHAYPVCRTGSGPARSWTGVRRSITRPARLL